MNTVSLKIITLIILLFNITICVSQDYLVTKDKDTIYGNIEWKSNLFVYVKNEDGKQKFRADQVDFFQRGAFKFVSVDTKFPEFLLEVKKGEISYYLESHLKSRFTIDYEKKVFLKYKDKLYPITVKSNLKNKGFLSNNLNSNTTDKHSVGDVDVSLKQSNTEEPFVSQSSNFKWTFHQILGKENTLYKLIKKNNYTFEDIELLIDLANISFKNQTEFKHLIDTTLKKGYAQGYLIRKKNDTIFGSIKMNGRFILSDKINFISKNGTESNFNPKDLIEFKINDRTYKNVLIKNKKQVLVQLIDGEISMYRDLKKGQSYLTKDFNEFYDVDKKEKYLELFKDKPDVYKRIIDNEYRYFEIKSIVKLYNNTHKI
ncbi:hypothetical protein SCB49_00380 [unidentified eubacterium SCB49]|nr:hypothetical protein SCB49_00380 [unidentified eubacterium SCB49]